MLPRPQSASSATARELFRLKDGLKPALGVGVLLLVNRARELFRLKDGLKLRTYSATAPQLRIARELFRLKDGLKHTRVVDARRILPRS